MKSTKHDWTLFGAATCLQFFFLRSFSECQKFPIHKFFRTSMFYENYLTSDFHTNTYLKTCLPTRQNGVENRDKLRPIIFSIIAAKDIEVINNSLRDHGVRILESPVNVKQGGIYKTH